MCVYVNMCEYGYVCTCLLMVISFTSVWLHVRAHTRRVNVSSGKLNSGPASVSITYASIGFEMLGVSVVGYQGLKSKVA